MKKHSILTELQLGRPINQVVEDLSSLLQDDHPDCLDEVWLDLDKIIKELVNLNRPNSRFHIVNSDYNCIVKILEKKWPRNLTYSCWDQEWECPKDHEAIDTCEMLNAVIRMLFLVEDSPRKAKINQEAYKKKGKICPFCNSSKIVEINPIFVRRNKKAERGMACSDCSNEWKEKYDLILSGFK